MNDHACYRLECYARQKKKLYTSSELIPKDDRERLMVESAYRRGYSQGFFLCIGIPASAARAFYDVIFKWRIKKHGETLERPPDFFVWLKNLR
jgi:hypothetical protein